MKILEGKLLAKGMRVAIVVARFNEFITTKLLGGAEDTLLRHGCEDTNITVVWVPGAFEIPFAAKKLAESKKYDAIIKSIVFYGSFYEIIIKTNDEELLVHSFDDHLKINQNIKYNFDGEILSF